MKSFASAISAALFLPAAAHAELLTPPLDLRCDTLTNPVAASTAPRLTWRVESPARGTTTSAWQVLAASTRAKLAAGEGDLWDSGKVAADRVPGTVYAGRTLTAGDVCHWKARWWNGDGRVSEWSAPATFEVAPHTPADWQGARWIDDGKDNPTRDEDFYEDDPAPLMRREFTIAKPVARARLHLAGLGLSLPSINGERLADHVFDPPWTEFGQRILFRTHDVTDRLAEGRHCLGIALGNGWYNPLPLRMWGHRNIREALTIGRPRAIALLVITHTDGTTTTVTTGDDWTTAPGPVLRNNLYLGEIRDARLDPQGWDRPGFDASRWKPVRPTGHPLDPLQPILSMPPARLGDPVPAKAVTSPEEGVHIVDFGLNLTAIPEMKLDVPAGTRVTFRFGEILHEDGSLNPMTSVCGQIKGTRTTPEGTEESVGGPGAPPVAWQEDVHIARGGGPETFRPDFTFHGFRYMEVTGLPGAPAPADCRAHPLRSDLPSVGSFSCSNDLFNRIQETTRHTFLANVVSVQSDCPHRERFAYGGDIVASGSAFLMNFDMHGFYAKTVRDWADAARPDGRLTDTAPFVGIDYCGVGWAMVHPLLLEQIHRHYGDRRLLEEQVPVAERWLAGVAEAREDGLVTGGLGDHEAMEPSRGPEFSTPMFIDTARRVARLGEIVGRDDLATRFRKHAAESVDAWEKAFLNTSTGAVGEGGQPAQAFALGFGAARPTHQDRVFHRLVAALTAPEDAPRLTTGIYGTRILLEELPARGRDDLAYALADRRDFPSWGWMLENGATTLWEDWEGTDGTKSHNHPMFGSVSAWFFRWLGGIQCAPDAVGFDRVAIRPRIPADLTHVRSTHHSIRGPITSDWSVEGDVRRFDITLPPDTQAVIELPRRPGDRITEGGRPLEDLPEIRVIDTTADHFRLESGSGSYRFEVAPSAG